MSKHTPGPWKYDATWGLIMAGRTEIAACHSGIKANAYLIAAAPEMLEVLKRVSEVFPQNEELFETVRKMIAKASGKILWEEKLESELKRLKKANK